MDDVDFYAQQGVEAVFYNLNFQRVFFPSEKCTPIWKDCEIAENGDLLLRGRKTNPEYKDMVQNSKALWEQIPDWMQFRYDYCKQKGIEMWHSMRMNDVHHSQLNNEHVPQHGDLWQERKDLIRAWYRHTWRSDWHDNGFDYAQQEVYDYHLNMAREYLLQWESDGIELDFLRSIPVFKPGYDEMNKGILTQFMRDLKALTLEAEKKFGHRIRIAVRVPYSVLDTIGVGMDIPAWANEKLMDVVIPGPMHCSTENTQEIELWRILLPEGIILAPCIDYVCQTCPGYAVDLENALENGFMSSYYQMGADSIYFYNHFPRMKNSIPHVNEPFIYGNDRNEVAKRARRQLYTCHQAPGEGKFSYCTPTPFPGIIWPQCCNGTAKINAGEQTAGRSAKIILITKKKVDVDILLNTVKCPLTTDVPDMKYPKPKNGEDFYFTVVNIPAGLLHDGWNAVEFFNRHATEDILDKDYVWLEIAIGAKA